MHICDICTNNLHYKKLLA